MSEYIGTWVVVGVISSITIMGFYECLRLRWKRRKKDMELFHKNMDKPRGCKGSPIRKEKVQRKAFIEV